MPAVARKDGIDSIDTKHGCDTTTVTKEGSTNVFVNGIGVVRKDDKCEIHNVPSGSSCVPHQVALTTYSSSVYANNKNVGRKDDEYDGHKLTSGSSNVFSG